MTIQWAMQSKIIVQKWDRFKSKVVARRVRYLVQTASIRLPKQSTVRQGLLDLIGSSIEEYEKQKNHDHIY